MSEFNALLEPFARLAAQPRTVVLIALLVAAAIIDWRTYRIPNWLTVSGTAFGLIYNTFAPTPSLSGAVWALAGMAIGFTILLPAYVLRVMGAGDVKLMAMVGAVVGAPDIVYAVLATLIVGGVVALAFALYRRAFRRMASNVTELLQSMTFAAIAGQRPTPAMEGRVSIGKFPYGISIAIGTIGWLGARQLGYA